MDGGAGPKPLSPPGRGRDRVVQRQQRDPGHADRLRQVHRRGRGALRRARRRPHHVLHGADQGAREREVLPAVRDLRRRERGDADRRRVGQQPRADHLLHGRGAGQHRAARGCGRGHRPGRDGRVPLLRRAAARVGVAGADPHPPAGPVPADERHARRRQGAARGPDAPHRARDRAGRRRRAPGAADVLVVARAAARAARGAGARRPGRRPTSCTSRRRRRWRPRSRS